MFVLEGRRGLFEDIVKNTVNNLICPECGGELEINSFKSGETKVIFVRCKNCERDFVFIDGMVDKYVIMGV